MKYIHKYLGFILGWVMMLTEEETFFWNNTFSKRLQVKIEQLIIYCSSISDLLKKPCCKPTQKKLFFLKKKITSAILLNKKILKSFSKSDFLENSDEFKKISNTMFKKKADLITDSNLILDIIEEAILLEVNRKELKKNLVDELVLLKIEIKNFGLGLGRTQVRLNANQLNNSISKEIDLKGDPDDPSRKRTYLSEISKLIENVKTVKINFGSILEENMNARKYFMVIKQMLKYIDENQSIRFLIAECDFSLTVMTALYYSKLFGVEDKVDISPLFETEKGLSTGHNVISTLLKIIIIEDTLLKEKNLLYKQDFQMRAGILDNQQRFYQLKIYKEK